VYDPVNKLTVLFGGDLLDQLVADTWVYSSAKKTWTGQKAKVSPSPRAGHAMLWLPKAKKILLIGGYTYTSTTEYVAPLYKPLPARSVDLRCRKGRVGVRRADGRKTRPPFPANAMLAAAVDDNDTVMILDAKNQAWYCAFDTSKPDAEATAKFGVKRDEVVRRTGSHDPRWYFEGLARRGRQGHRHTPESAQSKRVVRAADPAQARHDMDWGSAVFDRHNDKIIRFSGGHSAYSGTAPFVYDVKTDRYSLPFAPEYPIEYVYSNDQVKGEWSFDDNPWMTGHTYKSTGYDPNLKCLVFAAHQYTYFFDPLAGKWSRSPEKNPFVADFYTNTVCTTPEGAVVWANILGGGEGIFFLLDHETRK